MEKWTPGSFSLALNMEAVEASFFTVRSQRTTWRLEPDEIGSLQSVLRQQVLCSSFAPHPVRLLLPPNKPRFSKHHAIHVQHTTAAGVFLGLAISLTAGAFPSGLLSVLLALSAGATFQLASGTILGPVLAIPAGVGGARHAFLELLAMTAGAGGVVAIGAAEKMVGLGH